MFKEQEFKHASSDIQMIILDSLSKVGDHEVTPDQKIELTGFPTKKTIHRLQYLIESNENYKKYIELKEAVKRKGVGEVLKEGYLLRSFLHALTEPGATEPEDDKGSNS